MNDEIFISEKTGKRYKLIDNTYNVRLIEIIEPKLEQNDWYQYEEDQTSCYKNRWSSVEVSRLKEIRKANGEIWVKENNEWRKK